MPILKALALLGLALPLVSATQPALLPALTQSGISPWEHPEVVKVECAYWSGTAFRVGPQVLLSVQHVTSGQACEANGRPLKVIYHHGDFSVLTDGATDNRWLNVDCGGFIRGHHYTAIGYARGLDTQTAVSLVATGHKDGEQEILKGVFTVIPGQSGGAVIDDDTGRPVGTVNTFDPMSGESGSVELKTTSVCRSAA